MVGLDQRPTIGDPIDRLGVLWDKRLITGSHLGKRLVGEPTFRRVWVGQPIVELVRGLLDFSTHYEMVILRIGVGGSQSEELVGGTFRLKSKSFGLTD